MNDEMNKKLNMLLNSIKESLAEIKRAGKRGQGLKKAVKESRGIVTEVLEQQLGGISLEKQINISEIPDEDWLITAKHIIAELNDPFVPQNQYEIYFQQLINYLKNTDKETLLTNLQFSLNKMMQENADNYDTLRDFFIKYPFWGNYDPDEEDYSTFITRLSVAKQHSYDLLWLYRKTEDYLSKRTLAAILMNWIDLQTGGLAAVKSIFKDYCEPDIFPNNKNDVYVDIGAFTGDSIENYIQVYGKDYKKIYAYEPVKYAYNDLCNKIEQMQLHDIELRQKGAGSVKCRKYFRENMFDPTANSIVSKGDDESRVDIVRIDDDIKDAPTYIKINASGCEKDVIIGCQKTIKKYSPKLAVAFYYGYDDIWGIPSMIDEINPGYKFYIRFYGSEILPTGFVLICKADK